MGGGLAGNRRTVRPSPPYLKMSYNVKKKKGRKRSSVSWKSNNYDKRLHYGVEYVNLSKLCAPKGFSFLTSAEFLLKGLLTNTTTKKPTIVNRAFSLTWPASLQIYWNKRSRLHKKKVRLPQDWFGHQHGRRFIVLEHQYGRRDVMWKHSMGAFLWDDPDWDQWSEITRIMVDQMNWWIHSGQGFMGSFDLPWSKWSRITDPDPDHIKGTHPTSAYQS